MKRILLIVSFIAACSGPTEQSASTQKATPSDTDQAPMSYEDVQASLGKNTNFDSADDYYWKQRLSIYKDIYPKPNLSKHLNDFSACDSLELQRAYLNFSLVMNNYKDSGTALLPFFRTIYSALDQQMDDLEAKNRITIKDKLNINKTKSDINSAFAEIQLKSATK